MTTARLQKWTVDQQPAESDRLVITARFPNITPELLFDFWTQPELLKRWWPTEAHLHPVVGGIYHFAWPQIDRHLRGTFTYVERGVRLVFTWQWDHEPGLPERQVEVVFGACDEGACVTLTHSPYNSSLIDQNDRRDHLNGWSYFLAQLQVVTTTAGCAEPVRP
jgi:uncharacterized protein YndB with AHSA1/START domain